MGAPIPPQRVDELRALRRGRRARERETALVRDFDRDAEILLQNLRVGPHLRVAEVGRLDVKVENGKVVAFRARVSLSFKYEG